MTNGEEPPVAAQEQVAAEKRSRALCDNDLPFDAVEPAMTKAARPEEPLTTKVYSAATSEAAQAEKPTTTDAMEPPTSIEMTPEPCNRQEALGDLYHRVVPNSTSLQTMLSLTKRPLKQGKGMFPKTSPFNHNGAMVLPGASMAGRPSLTGLTHKELIKLAKKHKVKGAMSKSRSKAAICKILESFFADKQQKTASGDPDNSN